MSNQAVTIIGDKETAAELARIAGFPHPRGDGPSALSAPLLIVWQAKSPLGCFTGESMPAPRPAFQLTCAVCARQKKCLCLKSSA